MRQIAMIGSLRLVLSIAIALLGLRSAIAQETFPTLTLWRPDGQQIAVLSRSGQLDLIDVSSGEVRVTLGEMMVDVAWSPGGTLLAASALSGPVGIWDTSVLPPQQATLLDAHDLTVQYVAWNADGSLLATAEAGSRMNDDSEAYSFKIWDAANGFELIAEIEARTTYEVAWATSGSVISQIGPSGIKVFDIAEIDTSPAQVTVKDWNSGATQISAPEPLSSIVWSPDGNQILVGSWYGDVFVYDVTEETLSTFWAAPADRSRLNNNEGVSDIVWQPDEDAVAILYRNGLIEIRDYPSGDVLASFEGDFGMGVVSFSPDGSQIAFTRDDDVVIERVGTE